MVAFLEHIAHVDMDAFFVEVERLRRPDLRGRAVLVGGAGPRSVVATASYEARSRGVHSGMPIGQARRLCPHAVVVPPDHSAYHAVSREIFAVLAGFSPILEEVSVDEAFLDLSGLGLLFSGPAAVADRIRADVHTAVGLPCSVGVAATKLVAKMASRDAKPGGTLVVAAGTERAYLAPKPVRSLWGVGEATHARLEELGVVTIGDLAELPRSVLVRRLGSALGGMLSDLAAGTDERTVEPVGPARSISVEETYAEDLKDSDRMERELLGQADRLSSKLRQDDLVASTVHLKVRFGDFTTVTRSHTFREPVATVLELHRSALALLRRTDAMRRPVRLLGLGVGGLISANAPRQLDFGARSWDDIERAIEGVRDRFGHESVERARLVDTTEASRPGPGPE